VFRLFRVFRRSLDMRGQVCYCCGMESHERGVVVTESERERIIDRRVQARLTTDAAYRHAANAEEQAQREDEIEAEEDYRLAPATVDEGRWV
jgi:hypothetical protein